MWFGFGKKKKEITEKKVVHALMQVAHPELGRDVVALGLVKNLRIKGGRVSFDVTLTSPRAGYREELERRCREAVIHAGAASVKVRMLAEPGQAPPGPSSGKRPVPGLSRLLAVASGKGGVGKSTVSLHLALALTRGGMRVGLMDCDIYGPSIPALLGMEGPPQVLADQRIIPHQAHGLKVMSMGFLVERDHAVAWRGPMTHKMVQQFLFNVTWGDLDYLILDLPPGTGDVQLSLTQLTRIDAALIVTTPQEIALADVRKGVAMFGSTGVPVLGFVENMSYYLCPNCDKRHFIFKSDGVADVAGELQKEWLARIPLDPAVAARPQSAQGRPGSAGDAFDTLAKRVASNLASLATPTATPESWAQPGPGAFEV